MSESNWGRGGGGIGSKKKKDSNCKISNETVAEIEILFKEKKYLIFEVSFMDHDCELFNRLSPRKRRNIINLNLDNYLKS